MSCVFFNEQLKQTLIFAEQVVKISSAIPELVLICFASTLFFVNVMSTLIPNQLILNPWNHTKKVIRSRGFTVDLMVQLEQIICLPELSNGFDLHF